MYYKPCKNKNTRIEDKSYSRQRKIRISLNRTYLNEYADKCLKKYVDINKKDHPKKVPWIDNP